MNINQARDRLLGGDAEDLAIVKAVDAEIEQLRLEYEEYRRVSAKEAEIREEIIERLREALAHYATDERADGWIAIAALTATEEDKP